VTRGVLGARGDAVMRGEAKGADVPHCSGFGQKTDVPLCSGFGLWLVISVVAESTEE